jgi:hypothetical protein
MATPKPVNWKDHPLPVAAVTFAATTVLLGTIFFVALLPTWLKSNEAELQQLRKVAGEHQNTLGELSRLSLELAARKQENPFRDGDPYPLGFRLVRIGDELQTLTLESVYGKDRITWRDDWVEILTDDPLFEKATYFYQLEGGRKIGSGSSGIRVGRFDESLDHS